MFIEHNEQLKPLDFADTWIRDDVRLKTDELNQLEAEVKELEDVVELQQAEKVRLRQQIKIKKRKIQKRTRRMEEESRNRIVGNDSDRLIVSRDV